MIQIPRSAEPELNSWKNNNSRKVLLLRGARQVGKTYLVRKHGRGYKYYLEINFLSDKRAHSFFSKDIDIHKIIEQLSTFYNIPIKPGETLVFFDEIQECQNALQSLRFFYEKIPHLHVIAAGSLLEFSLSELPSFGVGRIQSLFLYPVSFDEYLYAAGEEPLVKYIAQSNYRDSNSAIHEKCIHYLKSFLFHGGLPEVASRFLEDRNYHQAANLLDMLRISFEDDFVKYQRRIPSERLREVLRSAALQAGKKFIHTHAYPDAHAGQVHSALELLNMAGVVHKVFHSSSNGLPLGSEINLKKFKIIPFDHGFYQRVIGITPAEVVQDSFNPINKGALAEVYAGCMLLANSSSLVREELFYWHREAKSSNAEVDYVYPIDGKIIPIEIKAGTKGQMNSMKRFLSEKKLKIGIRSSLENFGRVDDIIIVPLYALSQIGRLVRETSSH